MDEALVYFLFWSSSINLFEELSYLFFGLPFGFWDNKYNKYGAGKGNAGEYEVAGGRVDGVSEGGNHVGGGEGDQPVEGGADGGSYPLGGEEGNYPGATTETIPVFPSPIINAKL